MTAPSDPVPATPVHRADPRLRQQLMITLVVCLVAAGGGLWWLQSWLDQLHLSAANDPQQLERWLRMLSAGASLLVAAGSGSGALWLATLAERISEEQQWPPRSLRTTRDLTVLHGAAAAALARQFRSSAIALAGLTAATVLWAIWLGWPGSY